MNKYETIDEVISDFVKEPFNENRKYLIALRGIPVGIIKKQEKIYEPSTESKPQNNGNFMRNSKPNYNTYFFIRRLANFFKNKKSMKNLGKTIVIDFDQTICKTNVIEEFFKLKLGDRAGYLRWRRYLNMFKYEEYTMEEIKHFAIQGFFDVGVTTQDCSNLLKKLEKEGKIREELVEVMHYIKEVGRKIIVTTRISQSLADAIMIKYGFSFGVGPKEKTIKGKLQILEQIIDSDLENIGSNNVRNSISLIDRLYRAFELNKINFIPENIQMLSANPEDIETFKKIGYSILFVPKEINGTKMVGDYVVREKEGIIRELKLILRYPWALNARKRYKKLLEKRNKENILF